MLTHLATLTALPAWLVVSVSRTTVQDAVHHTRDSAATRLGHTTAVTAALWAGIAAGRFGAAVLFPSFPLSVSSSSYSSSSSSSPSSWRGGRGRGGERGDRPSSKVVCSSLVCTTGFLLVLVWFFSSRGTVAGGMGDPAAAAAAALLGVVLGPVYPWAVAGMLGRGMSEEETVSGVGITVAFGNVGMVAALFVTGLIAYLEAPGALHWAIAGLLGGMLLCWDALPDE